MLSWKSFRSAYAGVATAILLAPAVPVQAQPMRELFPQPIVHVHQLSQQGADGSTYVGQPVTDYYGGSWLVSVPSSQKRLVVDFAAELLTEVDPNRGTYWRVSFARFRALRERLLEIQMTAPGEPIVSLQQPTRAAGEEQSEPVLVVERVSSRDSAGAASGVRLEPETRAVLRKSSVQHVRVAASRRDDPGVDVWLDSSVRLSAAALAALERLERAVVGGPSPFDPEAIPPARYVATARSELEGAFVVRSVRQVGTATDGQQAVIVRDEPLRFEVLEAFPDALLAIPPSYRQSPHPFELAISEAERELRILAGERPRR